MNSLSPHRNDERAATDRAWTGSGWRLAIVLALSAVLIYQLRFVLLPFLSAAAFAYVGTPLVEGLHRRLNGPRGLAVSIVYLTFLAILAGAGYWIGSTLIADVLELSRQVPTLVRLLVVQILGGEQARILGETVQANVLTKEILRNLTGAVATPQQAIQFTLGGFETIMGFFLSLLLLFYFLLDGQRLLQGTLWLVPPAHRSRSRLIARQIHPMLGQYILGVIIVVTLACLISWIGIGLVLGLPHAVLLAIVTGVLEMIPLVGPIASAAIVGIVAASQGSLWTIVGVTAFFISLRLLIDQLIGPIVLGRAVTLHPTVIIFSFLTGAVLFGILGVVLAVPVAASVKIILSNIYDDPAAETP